MADLAQLLQNPPRDDLTKGLEQLRWSVLADGIPSNNDGMVRAANITPSTLFIYSPYSVRAAHLHLVDSSFCSADTYRCLS